jgi:hypothetical protein
VLVAYTHAEQFATHVSRAQGRAGSGDNSKFNKTKHHDTTAALHDGDTERIHDVSTAVLMFAPGARSTHAVDRKTPTHKSCRDLLQQRTSLINIPERQE